jgi:hypothetical protein
MLPNSSWRSTGLRPCKQLALKRNEVKEKAKWIQICRQVSGGKTKERIKTKHTRDVLLNGRALHAIEVAKRCMIGNTCSLLSTTVGRTSDPRTHRNITSGRPWLRWKFEHGVSTCHAHLCDHVPHLCL